ncbi:MAG: sulfatase activating formylglycine-generating enzyme [Bradymonadia bacterium]
MIVLGGTFLMGTPSGEIEPTPPAEVNQQTVEITHDLLVMETEVTQELWLEKSGTVTNPAFHSDCPACPVERVNWFEALMFANAVSELERLPACYELSECSGSFAGGCAEGDQFCPGFTCDSVTFAGVDCLGYRLPTEAEWEYLARADSTGPFDGSVEELAWFRTTLDTSESQPVGGKLPNAWGLFDLHGNVGEWVMDIIDAPYPESESTLLNPLVFGDADDVSELAARGVRGGGFVSVESAIRAASRGQTIPEDRVFTVGIRLVRTFYTEAGD